MANDEWPPRHLQPVLAKLSEWSAWYSGERAALESIATVYQASASPGSGFAGMVTRGWRRFWGTPVTDSSTQPKLKVHVPLAADIARASADLLFAEPPTIRAEQPEVDSEADPPSAEKVVGGAVADLTQEQLDLYLERGLIATLAEAAEVCAALGGVYLRAGWDFGSKQVFCSRVDADAAQPVFVWGRLVQVTFWHQLSEPDSRRVLRHLETHGLDEQGIGVIRHQLFEGTVDTLGTLVPLLDHPATSGLPVSELIDGDTISTGVPGLDVVYVPNVTPNPLWRNNITGSSLGAADICQAEDLLDRLDFVYSSLMRELDLARARIVVPEAWLTTHGPGRGQAFDIDREVFTGVNAPPADQVKAELLQPLIRVEEHLRTMQQITEDVLRRSGYSAATFGEDEDGAATATEVNSKNSRSRLTRQRKIRHWQPAVERLVQQMMRIDVALGLKYGPTSGFARGVDPELVMVTFPSPAMSSTELAGMVAAWAQAEAASIEIRVRTIHPDWDDTEVNDEVARIKEERGAALPDPGTFGQGGFGISDGLDGLSGQQGGPTPVLAAPAAPVAIGTA